LTCSFLFCCPTAAWPEFKKEWVQTNYLPKRVRMRHGDNGRPTFSSGSLFVVLASSPTFFFPDVKILYQRQDILLFWSTGRRDVTWCSLLVLNIMLCASALTGKRKVVHPHILRVSRPIYFFLLYNWVRDSKSFSMGQSLIRFYFGN
jgi:hypothetical protein